MRRLLALDPLAGPAAAAARIRAVGAFAAVAAVAAVAALALPAAAGAQAFDVLVPDAGCGQLAPATAPLHLDGFRIARLEGRIDAGPDAVVRGSTRRLACPVRSDRLAVLGGVWLELLPAGGTVQRNSAYPRHMITGLRWPGRGYSFDATGGVAAGWGPVSAALAPVFAYQQNAPFQTLEVTLPGSSPHAWYWRPQTIDWPQRFGDAGFWWSHTGESYIRVDAFGAALGLSTERLRWGPARRYPLLMSGAGVGFPHVFLGTTRPVDIWIGRLAVEAVWGHLAESEFFDGDGDNDTRVFAGLVAGFEPAVVPGLTLGLTRGVSMTLPPGGWSLADYFIEPYVNFLPNRPGAVAGENDLLSVFASWVFPAVEFEVYAEFARDDHWDGWNDLLMEPEHSAALTAGVQKLVPLAGATGARRLRLAAEATSLNFSETQRSRRAETIFYTHSSVRQGHTHRGRLLGTPTGPSSDAQALEIDWLDRGWMAGLHFERVRYANDIYWQAHASRYTYKGHDLELTGGIRGAVALPAWGLELLGDVSLSGRYNRGFIVQTAPGYQTSYERNLSVQLGAWWRPASGRTAAAGGPVSPPTRP